jgi:hypothetical protein
MQGAGSVWKTSKRNSDHRTRGVVAKIKVPLAPLIRPFNPAIPFQTLSVFPPGQPQSELSRAHGHCASARGVVAHLPRTVAHRLGGRKETRPGRIELEHDPARSGFSRRFWAID